MEKSCEGNVFIEDRRKKNIHKKIEQLDVLKLPKVVAIDIEKPSGSEESLISSDETKDMKFSHFLVKFGTVFAFLLLSGVFSVLSGLWLDYIKDWPVYTQHKVLISSIPPLISLIGNTVTTFASRLSTQVNIDLLNTNTRKLKAAWGNLSLVICQSTIVGALTGILMIAISSSLTTYAVEDWLFIISTCILTTAATTIAQTFLCLVVVFGCEKLKIDPDNIATPLAASIADFSTMVFQAYFANLLFNVTEQTAQFVCYGSVIGAICLILPFLLFLAFKNEYTKQALKQGWFFIIFGIVISGAGGYILGQSMDRFKSIGLYQPFFNALCGNIVSIMSSRTATYLHKYATPGNFPKDMKSYGPWTVLFHGSTFARAARRLLVMVIPAHLIMGSALHSLNGFTSPFFNPKFLPMFLIVSVFLVATTLYITFCLIKVTWRFKLDPDSTSIPIMTALCDLLGTFSLSQIYGFYEDYLIKL